MIETLKMLVSVRLPLTSLNYMPVFATIAFLHLMPCDFVMYVSFIVGKRIKEIFELNETFLTGFSEVTVNIWRSSNIVGSSINDAECVMTSIGDNFWKL